MSPVSLLVTPFSEILPCDDLFESIIMSYFGMRKLISLEAGCFGSKEKNQKPKIPGTLFP